MILLLVLATAGGCAVSVERWANPTSSGSGPARYAVFPFSDSGRARMTTANAVALLARRFEAGMKKAGYDVVRTSLTGRTDLVRDGVLSEDAARNAGRAAGATVAVFGNVIWFAPANERREHARVAFIVRGVDVETGMVLWCVSASSDANAGVCLDPFSRSEVPEEVAEVLIEKTVKEVGVRAAAR